MAGIGLVLAAVPSLISNAENDSLKRKPNVIFILIDDMGQRDVGCYESKFYEPLTHSTNFGIGLQQRYRELRIGGELVYPDSPDVKHQAPTVYLIDMLKSSK